MSGIILADYRQAPYTTRFFIGALRCLFVALGTFVLAFSISVESHASGLMVAPTRINLEPGEMTGQLFVVNRSDQTLTARISLVNRHMREDGSLEEAISARPGEKFADQHLRYAPRRIHLAPGEGQTVRVLGRPPKEAVPAEYRSHLLFRVEPQATKGQARRSRTRRADETGLKIRLTPVYGVSVPVIMRTGSLAVTPSIANLGLETGEAGKPRVTFQLRRRGEASIYGDLRVFFQPHSAGSERLVGRVRGVAVYPPLAVRHVSMELDKAGDLDLRSGRLRVEFTAREDNSLVLAEAERGLGW